jgi:hypothetical protein
MSARRLRTGACFVLAATGTIGCVAASNDLAGAPPDRQVAASPTGSKVTNAQLPINQRFRSLNEYLAFLEKNQAPIDKPWYRQIRPGVYELQTGNFRPLAEKGSKRVFTREELEKKFGFRH